MVLNSFRIVVIGFHNESKVIQIDFCREGELGCLLEQLALEYGMKTKDIFLVSPARPDQELKANKCLLGKLQIDFTISIFAPLLTLMFLSSFFLQQIKISCKMTLSF